MRTIVLTVLALGFLGCGTPRPQPFDAPVLFIGSLQSETLFPRRQFGGCENFFGEVLVDCISNSCGFGEAEFQVEKVLAGDVDSRGGVLRYSIGEWCTPQFALSRELLLIAADAYDQDSGEHRFRIERVFETENGDAFLPESIKEIDSLDVTSLLRPLPEGVYYGHAADFSQEEIEDLLVSGFIAIDEQDLVAVQGVFLPDLYLALSNRASRERN